MMAFPAPPASPNLYETIGGALLIGILGLLLRMLLDYRSMEKNVVKHEAALYGEDGVLARFNRVSAKASAQLAEQNQTLIEIKSALLGMGERGGLIRQVENLQEQGYRHAQALQAQEARLGLVENVVVRNRENP